MGARDCTYHRDGKLDDRSLSRGALDSSKTDLNSHRYGKFQGWHSTLSDDLLALARIRQRLLGFRIFTPAQPNHSVASSEGFLFRRLHFRLICTILGVLKCCDGA